jgi:hypothetical protein
MTEWFVGGVELDLHDGSSPTYTRGDTFEMTAVIEKTGAAAVGRYQTMQDRSEVADHAEYGTTKLGNQPWFKEQLPSDTSISTIVYQVDTPLPSTTPAFWGILTDFEDATTNPERRFVFDLDLWVIAQVADYPTRSDLDAQFSDTIV